MIFAFDMVENIVGKGENAFQKASFLGSLKVGVVCKELKFWQFLIFDLLQKMFTSMQQSS